MKKNNTTVLFFLFFLNSFSLFNQNIEAQNFKIDTLEISLPKAEELFLKNNYILLAQKFNIEATKALEIQAKLYPNPNFTFGTTLTNSAGYFLPLPFSTNGEVQFGLQQQIVLAGKINKAVKIAQANTKLTEFQFFDLIRTLKFTLRNDFFNIYFLQQSMKVYKEEIEGLQTVVNAYKELEKEGKGYISEKDIVRMKAQLYSLETEYQGLVDQVNDLQSEIKLILQVKNTTYIIPDMENKLPGATTDPLQYPLSTLLDSAYKKRTDLKIAQMTTEISRLNLDYQKALAKPDMYANWNFDQQGSYRNNLQMIGIAIDLPFFNRNQGNIKSAASAIKMNEANEKSTAMTVEENVYRALQKALDADKLYRKIDPSFGSDFERLMKASLENFKKRNMTILDFLDFYDAYKENTLQINSLRYNKLSALEQINFYTGTNFFN